MHQTLKNKENKIHTKMVSVVKGTSAPFFAPASNIQKKISVGSANDSYEVEADQVADKVMKMSELSPQVTHTGALVQRKCAACEQEEKLQMKPLAESISPLIQRSSPESGGVAPNHVENQINSSKGGGSVMDCETKTFMESRFGTDFSNVKIHTGSEAVQMNRELGAQAFAVGNDIYFNEGKYSPNSDSGKHLLAHELTHTVQQSGGIGRKVQKRETTGLCIKSFFGGEVRFNGLSSIELSNIAVINEGDFGGLTRPVLNGVWYNCDGYWYRGNTNWFKIGNHCKVNVYRGLGYDYCCNFAASLVKPDPQWVNDGLDETKSNPF